MGLWDQRQQGEPGASWTTKPLSRSGCLQAHSGFRGSGLPGRAEGGHDLLCFCLQFTRKPGAAGRSRLGACGSRCPCVGSASWVPWDTALSISEPQCLHLKSRGAELVLVALVAGREVWYLLSGASQVALVVKNPSASAGDVRTSGSMPGSGRPPGGGHGNLLQYACLESPMDIGAWRATVHKVAKSWTRLSDLASTPHLLGASPGSEQVPRHSGCPVASAQPDATDGALHGQPGALGLSPSLSGLGGLFGDLGVHSLPPGVGLGLEDR